MLEQLSKSVDSSRALENPRSTYSSIVWWCFENPELLEICM